jgi:hypothetical protein
MYGVEASSSGGGGLAAQAPVYPYLGADMAIAPNTTPLVGGRSQSGAVVFGSVGNQVAGKPMVSPGGGAVEQPTGTMMSSWRQVLDWHNSPAPWILLLILVLYGWLHVSVHASAGRRAQASAVL